MVAPACAGQAAPDTARLQRLGYNNGNVGGSVRDLIFSVTPVAGATPRCPLFYEFGVHFTKVTQFWSAVVPAETYRQAVFRSDQNWDVNPAGLDRLVFRIRRNEAQPGDRQFLLEHSDGAYRSAEWRVRAINANGMASPWSDWLPGLVNVSFGEP